VGDAAGPRWRRKWAWRRRRTAAAAPRAAAALPPDDPTPSALSPSVGRVREKEMGSDEFFLRKQGGRLYTRHGKVARCCRGHPWEDPAAEINFGDVAVVKVEGTLHLC